MMNIKSGIILTRDFYNRPTDIVAKDLLGKILIHRTSKTELAGKIVETEAYFGPGDEASHAFNGPTKRSQIMFEEPGKAYVYFCYGNHWLLNFVAKEDSQAVPTGRQAGAVLIRALEPVYGIDAMGRNRSGQPVTNLTNGPAKLTQALGIDGSYNGQDITKAKGKLIVVDNKESDILKIRQTQRIGISNGQDKLLRFYIEGNRFVSKG